MNCTLRRYLLSVFLLFVYLPTSATADELRDAVQAYNSKDYQTAYRIWRPLAEKGNALAQKCLGRMYEMGRGVPMDMVDAASWYRKAAEQGNPFAQLML
ncbi:MAG: sel1 repeat family protein, partial [Chloroflexi bacterium]|nr:sel1 repeat family protein [Chloroflexota bacterium]